MRRYLPLACCLLLAACVARPQGHELLNAVLWMQTSAEYRADCLAKYALARRMLDAALADPAWTAALEQPAAPEGLPPAVIMDLDETVLDNSRFEGELVRRRARYTPALWSAWVEKAEAGAVPGAAEFIAHARARGVQVIFITNRTAAEEPATRANLARLGLAPPPGEDAVLTLGERGETSSDKTSRRALVAQSHRILLLVGDDLGDFVSAKTSLAARQALVETHQSRFGRAWILLANPAYGSWEQVLTDYDRTLKPAQALSRQAAQVRGF